MANNKNLKPAQVLQPISLNKEIFIFNTLAYTQKLEKTGANRKLAEAIIQVFSKIIDDNFATKKDLKRDLRELELRLIIKTSMIMGSIVAVGATILALLITLK